MSDLRPRRELIEIGEEKFWLLFSIKAIDEIQSELNLPIFDAIEKLMQAVKTDISAETIRVYAGILSTLISSNGRKKVKLLEATQMLTVENYIPLAARLIELFWESMPEKEDYDPDEEDEDTTKKPERAINIAQILYIGCAVLGFSEKEVFHMTLRKFYMLYDQHLIMKGIKKDENIDEEDMFKD